MEEKVQINSSYFCVSHMAAQFIAPLIKQSQFKTGSPFQYSDFYIHPKLQHPHIGFGVNNGVGFSPFRHQSLSDLLQSGSIMSFMLFFALSRKSRLYEKLQKCC